MPLKSKFRSFLGHVRFNVSKDQKDDSADDILWAEAKEERRENPMIVEEILQSIDKMYYSEPSFDAMDYTLQTVPGDSDVMLLDKMRTDLRHQLQAVSKKLSDLVLENHSAYVQELQRVTDIEASLQTTTAICSAGRRHLANARQGVTDGGISILAKHRKRQKMLSVLQSLRTIKTLQQTDVRLREIMEEENYPVAVQLCLECQQAASTFREYSCVSELSSKLQDTQQQIELELEAALAKNCLHFDTHHYEKVQTAYRHLGKTQIAMDQLLYHFTTAVHNHSFQVVLKYAEKSAGNAGMHLQKMLYVDLCSRLDHQQFTPGLVELCQAMWEIMLSYYHTMKWHERFDKLNEETSGSSDKLDKDDGGLDEAGDSPISLPQETTYNRQYIKQKLKHGLNRIWQDVQQRVKPYLVGTDLSLFHIDNFIRVLDLIDRLMTIGEELSGLKSKDLQESIRVQSVNYFKTYHRARLDEMRMYLENDAWELCPVRSTFSIMQLHEFRFLRPAVETRVKLGDLVLSKGTDGSSDFFTRYAHHGNPFDETPEEEDEEIMSNDMDRFLNAEAKQPSFMEEDDDDDIDDELKREYVDEQTGEAPLPRRVSKTALARAMRNQSVDVRGPLITNTTLMILRYFGKYMQMMNVLKLIAYDVLLFMSQLFDFYLYTVYSFFGLDRSDGHQSTLSPHMSNTLERIAENLFTSQTVVMSPTEDVKVLQPHVSPVVNISNPETLFGLSERAVAVESLVFLAAQFEFLQPHLESIIPAAKRAFLTQFYSQTVSRVQELRRPIYRGVADKSLNVDKILHMMGQVKWDIKEIMSQHSSYVDVAVQEMISLKERLQASDRRVPLTVEASDLIWGHCIRLVNRTFVEGFASAKKCSNEGRALMQLDFQQFLMKLETLTNIRPIPDKQYVEVYVKAYYIGENDLEQWLRDHKEYSTKQLQSLVTTGVGSHLSKKSRQRLLSVVDEIDKSRR